MERSGPTPCALCLASLLCGSGAGGAPTAAADRHRCWTGAGRMYVLVCIAADFWPGLERASEGRTARRGIRFLRLSPPTSGLARIGRQGGAQLDAEFAFLRFSPPTSGLAWMGRWRGALPWHGACLSIFHSPASRWEAKLCSVTGPNTIEHCRPDPPPMMGWGRLVPLLCELNLLGRPCGAGWVKKE